VTKTEVGYEVVRSTTDLRGRVLAHDRHARSSKSHYDPEQISYETLLEVFWAKHNPTQVNRQGWDVGDQYRSVIFFHDSEQQEVATRSKAEEQTRHRKARRHARRAGADVLPPRTTPAVPGEAGAVPPCTPALQSPAV